MGELRAGHQVAHENAPEGVLSSRPAAAAPVPSTERGAWTCRACGFRGFWEGGPHCLGPALEAAFAHLERRAMEIGYPWGE
jgi:hypothetical protein